MNKILIYPINSSFILSMTIYPQDRIMGVEFIPSKKTYSYIIKDISMINSFVETQTHGKSLDKAFNYAIKFGKIIK